MKKCYFKKWSYALAFMGLLLLMSGMSWGQTPQYLQVTVAKLSAANGIYEKTGTHGAFVHDYWKKQGEEYYIYSDKLAAAGNTNFWNLDDDLDDEGDFISYTSESNLVNAATNDGEFATFTNPVLLTGWDTSNGDVSVTEYIPATAPTVTTQVVTDIAATTATGNGTVSATGGANITERGVYYSTTNGFANGTGTKVSTTGNWSTTGAFTQAITGLTAGTTYYVKAFATNSTGTSYGSQVSYTTLAVPGAPTSVSATAGNAQASVSFTAPASNGGSAITGYTVTSNPGGFTGTGASSPITVTGLSNGTAYTFTVTATNSVGTSSASTASASVTPNPPGTLTGNTDTDWNTASNWAGNSVPTSGTDVTIPTGKTVVIGPTTTANCNNLTITGTLTIESSAAGTGSLIISGTTSGNATVQRYVTSGGWRLIASPVTGQTVGSFLTGTGSALLANPLDGTNKAMKDYNEAGNTWNGLSYYTHTGSHMEANKGYAVWPNETGTISFTGELQSGSKQVNVVKNGLGWNCIGNPFTSAIAINSAASGTNFIGSNSGNIDGSYGAIYLWEQGNNSYTIVRLADAAYYASVGQGFFVKAASTGIVNFTSTIQSHQTTAPFKSSNIEWPQIKLEAVQGEKSNSATVKFNNAMSRSLDFGYDAGIMRTGFDVFTKLVDDNGVDFGIQCLPLDEIEGMVVPVGINNDGGGNLELRVSATDLPNGVVATLEDRQLGTNTPVTEDGANILVAEGSKLANRFFLHVGTVTSVGRVSDWGKQMVVTMGNGKVTVSGIDTRGCTATLYDVQGRRLFSSKLGSNTAISTQGLVNGIYLLEVKQQGNVAVKRISVND